MDEISIADITPDNGSDPALLNLLVLKKWFENIPAEPRMSTTNHHVSSEFAPLLKSRTKPFLQSNLSTTSASLSNQQYYFTAQEV